MTKIESKENISNISIQPSKSLARRLKRDIILLGTGLGLAVLVTACGSTPEATPLVKVASATATSVPTEIPATATATSVPPTVEATKVPTKEPTKTPTIVPTIEPTKVPTIEPTKAPTVAPTKEAVQEAPCGIFSSKEICSQADVIRTIDQLGRPTTYIGLRNLPDNLSINTDRKGQILKAVTNQSEIKGAMAIIVDPNSNTAPQSGFFGRMKFKNNLSENVAEGYTFAYTDTGAPNPENQNFGDYDLLFTIRNPDGTPNEALLKALFPVSYTRPAIEAAYQGKGNGPTVLSPQFSNNNTPPK